MIYITYTMCMYIYILLPLPLKSFEGLDDCKIKEKLQHNEKHHLGFVELWGLFFFKDYTDIYYIYHLGPAVQPCLTAGQIIITITNGQENCNPPWNHAGKQWEWCLDPIPLTLRDYRGL